MTGTLSVKLDFSTLHVEANSVVEVPKGFSQGISNRNCFHEISKRFFCRPPPHHHQSFCTSQLPCRP